MSSKKKNKNLKNTKQISTLNLKDAKKVKENEEREKQENAIRDPSDSEGEQEVEMSYKKIKKTPGVIPKRVEKK